MNNFSLSISPEKAFPTSVTGRDGKQIPVNADFRVVLRCFKALDDPELPEDKKLYLLMRWFFSSCFVSNALELFMDFVNGGGEPSEDDGLMDFEQDADAIYVSFIEQYGIDLMEIKYMHWRKFLMLVSGLGKDTSLGVRISIRDMDTSKMKGEEKIKADKAKRRFALKEKMSKAEKRLQDKLNDALANGLDTTAILAELKEMYGGGINGC